MKLNEILMDEQISISGEGSVGGGRRFVGSDGMSKGKGTGTSMALAVQAIFINPHESLRKR